MTDPVSRAEGNGWMPIETAPKDGSDFLARWITLGDTPRAETIIAFWSLDTIFRGFYGRNVSCLDGVKCFTGVANGLTGECLLTHWQPLPSFP